MSVCEYVIDDDDRIVTVCDRWLAVAAECQPGLVIEPESVLARPIWEAIDGEETHFIYKTLLKKVRAKHQTITLPFRCDSPTKRRFLELTLMPLADNFVKFVSRLMSEEDRAEVPWLDPDAPRSGEYIRMCSMCKKVVIAGDYWAEVEVAVAHLKLFEKAVLPQITHGFCPECFRRAWAEIEELDCGRV